MGSALYSVKADKKGCVVRILARDTDAKQVLFGWGSDHGPSIHFYGRGTRRGTGDNELWEWKLPPAAVRELKTTKLRPVRTRLPGSSSRRSSPLAPSCTPAR
jgi:hypothetical protein